MTSLKQTAEKIAKSSRLKKALFSEEATDTDLFSIFVDFGLSIFEATKDACARKYGQNRYMNSTDIKKMIRDVEFPANIVMAIR